MESGAHIKPNMTTEKLPYNYTAEKIMYTVPLVNDLNILKNLDSTKITDFPAIDLFGYPITDISILAKTFDSYRDANSDGYPYNHLLIKSRNISLYQIIESAEEREVIQQKLKYIVISSLIFKVCPL